MICTSIIDIPIQPIQTPVEEAKKIFAFTPITPKAEEAKPLKGRQVEPQEIKQILKEGCDILNRSIEQKAAIAKKEHLKWMILTTALVVAGILAGIATFGIGITLEYLMLTSNCSLVASVLLPILTILGLGGTIFGSSFVVGDHIDAIEERSVQQKREIAALKQWIRTAGELQQKSPAIKHLEQYGNLADVIKKAEKAQKRKSQDLLVKFVAVVQTEKQAMAQRSKPSTKPCGIMQRIKEQKVTVAKMRGAIAHFLKKVATAIQP